MEENILATVRQFDKNVMLSNELSRGLTGYQIRFLRKRLVPFVLCTLTFFLYFFFLFILFFNI